MNRISKHPTTHERNKNTDPQHQETKWATFTYIGKEMKRITKLFKETPIKIASRTQYKT
jgi:hypothetical protein